jgi:hypothetical protein
MDDFFLYPGESKGQHSNTRQKVLATQAIEQEEWLIEGAFGYMADWALPRATGLIWIDLPWEEVLDNFWERSTAGSSKSREEILRDQWAGYEWMKGGIEWLRSNFDDENTNWCSRYFHGYLCDCFRGWKRKLSSRNEVTAFAQTCKQQFTDMQREGGRYE